MRKRKELTVVLLLLVGVAALTGLSYLGQSPQTGLEVFPLRTSYSSRPNGTKALYVTLKELHFPVARSSVEFTRLPSGARLLLVIAPRRAITSTEWKALKTWVAEGRYACLGLEDQLVPEWAEKAMDTPDDVFTVHTALPTGQTALSKRVKKIHFRGVNRLDAQFYESIVAKESAAPAECGRPSANGDKPNPSNHDADEPCDDADT